MWIRGAREHGFSLLEVLMALGLLSIALLAVFRLQASNLDLQAEARFLTEAGFALQCRSAEHFSRSGYSEGVRSGSCKDEYPGLSFREEFTQVPGKPHLYRVRIRLSEDTADPSRAVYLDTYLWDDKQ
jgi:prepilin-type N-terminal cleavage/methylation domain-containing protein